MRQKSNIRSSKRKKSIGRRRRGSKRRSEQGGIKMLHSKKNGFIQGDPE